MGGAAQLAPAAAGHLRGSPGLRNISWARAGRRLSVALSASRYVRRRDLVRLDSLAGGGARVARGLQVDRVALTYLAG